MDGAGMQMFLLVVIVVVALVSSDEVVAQQKPTSKGPETTGHRLPSDQPELDETVLSNAGLHRLQSRRLILVTDLPLDSVRELPLLADALFTELEKSLGPLAPDPGQKEFQVTGFLIDAKERFEKAGLLPPEQFSFRHGRNLGYRFWLNNQATDYYRRHLLLHEFVHCFMMCEYGRLDIPPLWYTEGIAEYFATHELASDISTTRFGVLPASVAGFEGWGRIATLKTTLNDDATERLQPPVLFSLDALRHPADNSFIEDEKYAQAWAIVWLIRNHPELKPHFSAFDHIRNRQQFQDAQEKIPQDIWNRLQVIWPLWLDAVIEGFDKERSFPELGLNLSALPASERTTAKRTLLADRDWQSTGLTFSKGQTIGISCSGRCTVHDEPKPWIAEPQGISIDFYRGRPLGEITAMLISPDGKQYSFRIPVGRGTSITMPYTAELWLQINDSAAQRKGNSGTIDVELEFAAAE